MSSAFLYTVSNENGKKKMTDATSGAGTAYPSGAPEKMS
jgi:hypothetical protein